MSYQRKTGRVRRGRSDDLDQDVELFDRVIELLVRRLRESRLPGLDVRPYQRHRSATDGWYQRIASPSGSRLKMEVWFDRYLEGRSVRRFSIWVAATDGRTIASVARRSGLQLAPKREDAHRGDDNLLRRAGAGWVGRWFVDAWPGNRHHYFGRYCLAGDGDYATEEIVESMLGDVRTLLRSLAPEPRGENEVVFPTSGEANLALVEQREGQDWFRDRVVAHFHGKCAVSGCEVVEALEAAHIVPWSEAPEMNPRKALLLRADLHTLFDKGLLRIVRRGRRAFVELAPTVAVSDTYGSLAGALPAARAKRLTSTHWEAIRARNRSRLGKP